MSLQIGQFLQTGRYEVINHLGKGGMGTVYLALDHNLMQRKVALKENADTSPETQEQFQHEAAMLAHLTHPNLPRVTDHFIEDTGRQYLIMDFIEGQDLSEVIRDASQPMPELQVMEWSRQVIDALAYMHTRVDPATRQLSPIIHRDIKPSNIKRTPNDRVVLVDFGLAKYQGASEKTEKGARAFSPGYSPVEQYTGGTDARSDIYALGATLYRLVTNQIPPAAPIRAAGTGLLDPREINSYLSTNMAEVILRAMSIKPDERFQTIHEMQRALSQTDYQDDAPTIPLPGTNQSLTPSRPNIVLPRTRSNPVNGGGTPAIPTSQHPISQHPASQHPTSPHPTSQHPTSPHPTSQHPTTETGLVRSEPGSIATSTSTQLAAGRRNRMVLLAVAMLGLIAIAFLVLSNRFLPNDGIAEIETPSGVTANNENSANGGANNGLSETGGTQEVTEDSGGVKAEGQAPTEALTEAPTEAPEVPTLASGVGEVTPSIPVSETVGAKVVVAQALPAVGETPMETRVPTNTRVPTEPPTDTPVPIDTPLPSNTPTEIPADTPTEIPTDTPTPTDTATEIPTNTPSPTETSTETPTPSNTPTETPTPSNTPTETPTNTPTPLPQPAGPPLAEIGGRYENPVDGATYVAIPGGPFERGSPDSKDAQPVVVIELDGFWIMETEVTYAQYANCIEEDVCTAPNDERWRDPAFALHPAANISWEQAQEYAEWAGGRLPTEAEWEKAAKGTTPQTYPWGNQSPSRELLNNLRRFQQQDEEIDTMPVGSYPLGQSPYGLLDMAGNVSEWTQDWFDPNYYAQSPTANPQGPEAGVFKVVRGGAFNSPNFDSFYTAARDRAIPQNGFEKIGFRVVIPE